MKICFPLLQNIPALGSRVLIVTPGDRQVWQRGDTAGPTSASRIPPGRHGGRLSEGAGIHVLCLGDCSPVLHRTPGRDRRDTGWLWMSFAGVLCSICRRPFSLLVEGTLDFYDKDCFFRIWLVLARLCLLYCGIMFIWPGWLCSLTREHCTVLIKTHRFPRAAEFRAKTSFCCGILRNLTYFIRATFFTENYLKVALLQVCLN